MKRSFLVVDDHAIVRYGVALLLKKWYLNPVIYQVGNLKDALGILGGKQVDLVFLDINIPDGRGTDMVHDIKKVNDLTKILVFSALDEEHFASRYLLAGVDGYVHKFSEEKVIQIAIDIILRSGKYVSAKAKEALLGAVLNQEIANPLDRLSARELEIASLLVKGFGNLEISNRFNIHASTVSTYKSRIYEKLNVDNIISLAELFAVNRNVG
ncbi:response regulator [Belliella marina]|uniref:Response regulator n=1 Tax=Belliella marina TaxID=1644146 RepID=A0ABW4VMV5_9BACT